jgi:hypothetical protein
MSIQREEIEIKNFTTGTTLLYFSTQLDKYPDIGFDIVPTIVEFDNNNNAVDVNTFDGVTLWKRNTDHINVILSSITNNYITGHSYSIDVDRILRQPEIDNLKTKFITSITAALNTGATTYSESTNQVIDPYASIPAHTEYLFHNYQEIEDFWVNIKMNRTHDTLDTLNIYNNLVNSMPTQESDTGVVFGRLMARQTIKDVEGNNVSIPLRNTPIGIFNASEDYPTSTSTDVNGDRLFLNNKENAFPDEYFNIESFSADTNDYLRSASHFTTVPDQYKYITTTNENGEFIIYDVPIGSQIAVFEVDLFKQGLTKDEIALNFFQFPPNDDSILDTIPNFSFKQFPVNIVKSWGTIQTGYTELNITVNYDLKKWATYYLPPMAYDNNKLGSVELLNFSPSLNVDIIDMSREGFPVKNIPVVEIHKIYDKDEEHTLLWESEFAQLKKTAKFFEHGFRAFKVPANMYDPKGYRTDIDGIPRTHPTSQGVWLAGYQFKLYYNQPGSIFRTTGFQRDWGFTDPGWRGRDHFHRNRGESSGGMNTDDGVKGQSFPPYDKPWTHLYPDEYSIPAKPVDKNFNRVTNAGRLGGGPYYLEQPEYKDGDLNGLNVSAGSIITAPAGGYGVQYSLTNNFWFPNRFSKEVTASFIYKYEAGVAWNETYSNGYEPYNGSFPIQPGVSKVLNGEKYQRAECGYGYWLRPEGWPPVSAEPWGDTLFSQATRPGAGMSADFGPGQLNVGESNGNNIVQAQMIPIDVYNFEDKDVALALDNNATYSEGALSLYRVIDPNDRIEISPEVIPTFATYSFGPVYFKRGATPSLKAKTAHDTDSDNGQEEYFSKLTGGSPHAFQDYQFLKLKITNNGNITVTISGVELGPGGFNVFDADTIGVDALLLTLPGNSNFDFGTSKYMIANYSMQFQDITHRKKDGDTYSSPSESSTPYNITLGGTSKVATSSTPVYHLTSRISNARTQFNNNNISCTDNVANGSSNRVNTIEADGMLFMKNSVEESNLNHIRFEDDTIANRGLANICGSSSSWDGDRFLIPIAIP